MTNDKKCLVCGKKTTEKHKFSDDPKDKTGHLEPCCRECYERIREKNI